MGRVGRPHGLVGFVTIEVLTDAPGRFRPGASVFVGDERMTVKAVRAADRGLLVRFEGCDDRDAAERLRGREVTIEPHERRALEEEEFWPDQLEGLEVRLPDGTVVGSVVGVVEGPAQDRLVVETGHGRVEVPFVVALVPDVRIDDGYVVVEPLPGLFNEA